jgi:molybdenum cofactor sulfurtransferase
MASVDSGNLRDYFDIAKRGGNNLFAYPAQSNFSGVQHALEWIDLAHKNGWDVLLDAAAFVPTNRLDLSAVHPDFVALSFYKIFGYPTGIGALIARRSALGKLHRPWFAGGTITVASVQGDRYFLHLGAEGFEDGTLNYLGLPAIEIGLRHIAGIGYDAIHTRVTCLTEWLLEKFSSMQHSNGTPVMKIYGPLEMTQRGGTITLNFFDMRGHFVDHLRVEERANRANISLRTGCFCNPGGGEVALGLSAAELNTCFALKPRMEFQDFRRCIDDKSTGAVRVSVGLVTTFEDVYRLVEFASGFIGQLSDEA